MLTDSHREFFKVITQYNQAPAEKRAQLLAGMIFSLSCHHPDPKTRLLLSDFYAKEVLKNAAKPKDRPGSR